MMKGVLLILTLCLQTQGLNDVLNKKWDNKFVKHHQVLQQALKDDASVKNCWICTHAPISSTTMPYLAIPLSVEDILWYYNNTVFFSLKGKKKSNTVPLTIAAWLEEPWLMFNRTLPGGHPLSLETDMPFKKQSLEVSCYPNVSQCLCLEVKGKAGRKLPKINSTDCQGNESPDTQCVGIMVGTGINPFCVSSTLRAIVTGMKSNDTSVVEQIMMLRWGASVLDAKVLGVPDDIYIVCGNQAYKWLPADGIGICTLARLTPATFIVPHNEINVETIPRHTLYKRAADNRPRPNGKPHVVSMGATNKVFSVLFVYPMMMQMWDKLVEATDYLDDQIWEILDMMNTSNLIQNQLIITSNQHTIVLDYLTAAQGGMCQMIGPTCCHYIDSSGNLQVKVGIERIRELRNKWLEARENDKDSWWSNTFSFLNPANWFRGIGGWLMGILQAGMQILLFILLIYVCCKGLIWLTPKLLKSLCRTQSKTKSELLVKHHKTPTYNTTYEMS